MLLVLGISVERIKNGTALINIIKSKTRVIIAAIRHFLRVPGLSKTHANISPIIGKINDKNTQQQT